MKIFKIAEIISARFSEKKGMALILVLSFMALASISAASLTAMVQRDVGLIRHVKDKAQARYAAEAGINHALADITENGFGNRADFVGNLDTGSYSVTYSEVNGRYLVTSVGTVSGMTATSSTEIRYDPPTALNYFSGAGNDIKINSLVARALIVGDVHANNNVYLKSGPLVARLEIHGEVSATGIVKEGSIYNETDGLWGGWLDRNVVINDVNDDEAMVYEGEERITFPTFPYEAWKQTAIDAGDYYAAGQNFNGVTLSPSSGITYINGDVTFRGNCVLNGSIVANNITIVNTLSQYKTGNINSILAKTGDIQVYGRLFAEEALVCAARDIMSLQALAEIEINGTLLARRDIDMWNFLTMIEYNYVYVAPPGITGEDGELFFSVASRNR